jgi:RNA polymerase nonessential primary-like sigma factor
MQRLKRSPTRAELAGEVNKTEAELTQIQKLGQLAKHLMITANLRLVVTVAKKYRWSNLEFLDLIQEGAIGLLSCGREVCSKSRLYNSRLVRTGGFGRQLQ